MARQRMEGPRPVLLEPVAAPVNTYVRPAEPERSGLWALANSLGNFEGNLAGFVQERKAQADKIDAARGEAAFYQNNQAGYDEAVKQGLIPSYASPHFVEAYKEAQGGVAGLKLASKFQADYDAWGGKNGEDPAAFDGFFQAWLKENIPGETDPFILRGMLPHVRAIAAGGEATWSKDLHENTYSGSREAHAAMGSQAVDQYDLEGFGRQEGTDYDALYTNLTAIRGKALKTLRTDDVDKDFVDTITAKAVEKRDPKLLELLDREVPGESYTWADTPYGRTEKAQATAALEVLGRRSQEDAEKAQTAKDKQQKLAAQSAAIDWLIQNPGKPVPEEVLKMGSQVDGTFRVDVLGWQKTISEGTVAEDPQAIAQLYTDIFKGGGMGAIQSALTRGVIRSSSTLSQASSFAKSLVDPNSPGARIMKGPVFDGVKSAIKARTTPDGIENPWTADGMSDGGLSAMTDYQIALARWAAEHPEATDEELYKAQRVLGDAILQGVPEQVRPGDSYNRTPEAAGATGLPAASPPVQGQPPAPTTEAPPQAPPATPPLSGTINPLRPQGEVATPTLGPAEFTPEVRARIDAYKATLSPRYRETIENAAKKHGVSPDAVIEHMLRKAQPGQQTPGPRPSSMGPQSSLDAVNQMAGAAAPFADAILAAYAPDTGLGGGSAANFTPPTGRAPLVYTNRKAIRNRPIQPDLADHIGEAVAAVFGPGYHAEVFSGGQGRAGRRTGSHRHDDGRAADVYVVGPDGRRLSGDQLAALGQYWAARQFGGVGMEMHGGGVHLDNWSTPPKGGGMTWNYSKRGGRFTPAQKDAIERGLRGELPPLRGGGERSA